MLDKNNEVFFGEYCKTCKYKNYSETDCPCSECIAEPVNLYSHKPIKWEGADGVFSGPPPRPDHAYQRAVKYVPERRKDKEKAIARQNIDAEYAGNKVQSISDSVTDDQYPSATAVKKALESKIDAPQVAQVGEVLTVEEVDADGKPKKWKTQTVEKDWNENDPTKPGYIKNRPFYKSDENPLGLLAFTATSSNTMTYTVIEMGMDVIDGIYNLNRQGYVLKIVISGRAYMTAVGFDRGHISISSGIDRNIIGDVYYRVGSLFTITINDSELLLTSGETYNVEFYDISTPGYVKIPLDYMPKEVFTQNEAPVKYGTGELSTIQGSETIASGECSHAEGGGSIASGNYSHAEGSNTKAYGECSHAEGSSSIASGYCSHAEGSNTEAYGYCSRVEGFYTVASNQSMNVSGEYNIIEPCYKAVYNKTTYHLERDIEYYCSDTFTFDAKNGKYSLVNPTKQLISNCIGKYLVLGDTYKDVQNIIKLNSLASGSNNRHPCTNYYRKSITDLRGRYSHIVGNGNSDTERSNSYTLDWEGNAWFAGDVYVHSTSGTNKDDGSVRLVTEDLLTSCVRLLIGQKKNNDGTITYSSNFPALFIYYEIFKGHPVDAGNSVECCLLPIEDDGPLTVLNYTGMSIDQNSDGNIVLAIRFSSYVSGKQISAEIKDTISGFGTDNEERLSTVVTVTENALVSCSMIQELTREQQELAKQNIGAGTLRKVYYWDVTNDTLEAPNSVMRCAGYGDTCICLNQTRLPHGMVGPVLVIYGEVSYGRRDATAFDGSNATWTFSVNLNDYSYSTPIKKSGIPTPTTAQVGQIVKVKAVNTDGKVTETEAVDMPTQKHLKWITVHTSDLTEEKTEIVISTDSNGKTIASYNPIGLTLVLSTPADSTQTDNNGAPWIYPSATHMDNAIRVIGTIAGWKTTARDNVFTFIGGSSAMSCVGNVNIQLATYKIDGYSLDGVKAFLNGTSNHFPIGTHIEVSILCESN